MGTAGSPFTLASWRREVAELYAGMRNTALRDAKLAAAQFRAGRDSLISHHTESPLSGAQLAAFKGIDYYPYDPAWRLTGTIDRGGEPEQFDIDLADDGMLRCSRAGVVRFRYGQDDLALAVYWMEGYGGGLWLPFGDTTNNDQTYGGGRYLYDSIKGADLGVGSGPSGDTMLLDFNFAYNPSCAYDHRWSCPLAPSANRLPLPVRAGERAFSGA
ncbi:MAG: DUF1684 domain-containing protein [Betaproteobacteria bacterium]